MKKQDIKYYIPLPTLLEFHRCPAQIRCVVGPVGSGKTTAAAIEMIRFIPEFFFKNYGVKKTRGVILRNTYDELIDTTQKSCFDWFPPNIAGTYRAQRKTFNVKFADGIEVEVLFRSCDRPEDVKKFKSLEISWYWIDESIEVADAIKRMLKNRIGRYPARKDFPNLKEGQPTPRFGVETTNPPDVTHPTYTSFKWTTPPPGPIPNGKPLKNHVGFWQPPGENNHNLRPHYYDELRSDYADNPDWVSMYIDGEPGVIAKGKLVYNNFRRKMHVSDAPLVWGGQPLYRGWDDSGNVPACVVGMMPTPGRVHILREFCSDKMNIVEFSRWVVSYCNELYPNGEWQDWDDPAGWNTFSRRDGTFTSNAKMIQEATNITMIASEQNFAARINAVDQQLSMIDGYLIDPQAVRLINGFLGGYCYPEIGTTGAYRDTPDKNKFSHVHDANQYLIVKLMRSAVTGRPYKPPRRGSIQCS